MTSFANKLLEDAFHLHDIGPARTVFFVLGSTTVQATFTGRKLVDLDHACLESFHAMDFWQLLRYYRSSLLVLTEQPAPCAFDTTTGLHSLLAPPSKTQTFDETAEQRVWDKVENPERQIVEGSIVTVGSPIWRAAIHLALYRRRKGWLMDQAAAAAQAAALRNAPLVTRERLFRQSLHRFLTYPQISWGAFIYFILLQLTVLLAVLTILVETQERLKWARMNVEALFGIEVYTSIAFTIDFALRLYSHLGKMAVFVRRPYTYIELASFLPFYIERGMKHNFYSHSIPILSVLRIVNLSRLFQVTALFRGIIGVLTETFRRSTSMISILLFLTTVATVFMAATLFFAERGDFMPVQAFLRLGIGNAMDQYECTVACPSQQVIDATWPFLDVPYKNCVVNGLRQETTRTRLPYKSGADCASLRGASPFNSIPASMYFVVTTLTTLGYGDVVPFTPLGKLLSALTMFLGLIVISLPVAVISGQFENLFSNYDSFFTQAHALDLLGIEFNFASVYRQERFSDDHHIRRLKMVEVLKRVREQDLHYGSSDSDDDEPTLKSRLLHRLAHFSKET